MGVFPVPPAVRLPTLITGIEIWFVFRKPRFKKVFLKKVATP